MKVLWLTWKDHLHPDSGGAELVLYELSKRLVHDGHEVTWLTSGYMGSRKNDQIDGINIIRIGSNRYLHSFQALMYYVRKMRNTFDIVIEVVNTAPYFSVFFGKKSKRFLFYHQLAREIWFYETKAPLSQFGYYILEPLATRLLAHSNVPVITVSNSTKLDLARYGFKPNKIHIISEGIELEPIKDPDSIKKYRYPTLLSLGSMRAMKRTIDQIKAFEIAKKTIKDLQMKIAGDSSSQYGQLVLEEIRKSRYSKDINYVGKVSKSEKVKLLQKSHVIVQTSIKEGWGLTISEANSQGTPAVVYDVDGLRDSVKNNKTGYVSKADPESMAKDIVKLFSDPNKYDGFRRAGWKWSSELSFDACYKDIMKVVEAA